MFPSLPPAKLYLLIRGLFQLHSFVAARENVHLVPVVPGRTQLYATRDARYAAVAWSTVTLKSRTLWDIVGIVSARARDVFKIWLRRHLQGGRQDRHNRLPRCVRRMISPNIVEDCAPYHITDASVVQTQRRISLTPTPPLFVFSYTPLRHSPVSPHARRRLLSRRPRSPTTCRTR